MCDCAGTNYEGEHCEFVRGSQPPGWATTKYGRRSSAADGMKSGGKAVLTLFMLGLFGAVAFFTARKHRNKDEREEIDPNAPTSPTNEEDASAAISPTSMKKLKNLFSTKAIGHHLPSDLELEADGGVLKSAMKNSQQGLGDAEDEMTNEENGVGAGDDDDDEIDDGDVVDVEII